jgi:energy-coupling factor transport system ATP-binding protein
MALARVDGLTFTYPGSRTPALADVSLELEAGEAVALLGPSGGGKSTLLRALAGLVPHFHGGRFAGRVEVCGRDTRRARPAELAGSVASVFQDPEDQVVMAFVANEVAFGLENLAVDAAAIWPRVDASLSAVDATHLRDRRTSELSGGELQRVCLASALALEPALLLLDEPTSQLDPLAAEHFLASLERAGAAVVLAEQRVERALALAARVLYLEAGRLLLDAPAEEAAGWLRANRPHYASGAGCAERSHFVNNRSRPVNRPSPMDRPGPIDRPSPVHRPCSVTRRHDPAASLPAEPERLSDTVLQSRDPGRAPQSGVLPGPLVLTDAAAEAAAGLSDTVSQGSEVVVLRGVSYAYRPGVPAVDGVSLVVRRGEIVALEGPNGSGKTTLAKLAAGLLEPQAGTVRRRGRAGYLLQDPGRYLVRETVLDEVALAVGGDTERARAELDRLGLARLAARHPRDLSSGERERLGVAAVAVAEPDLLVLDEPTRGLDPDRKAALSEWLLDYAGRGRGVLVATHDRGLPAHRRVSLAEEALVLA